MARIYVASAFFFVAIVGLVNPNAWRNPSSWDRLDFDTGIGSADALVINVGLATFVAVVLSTVPSPASDPSGAGRG